MPHSVLIGLFVSIIACLCVIVWWEVSRLRGLPRSVARAFKQHVDTESSAPRARAFKEVKRGFDGWK